MIHKTQETTNYSELQWLVGSWST